MVLVWDLDRKWIAEDAGCFFEGDAMFAQIPAGLGVVPFESHSSNERFISSRS
jgi:hypothetical protein